MIKKHVEISEPLLSIEKVNAWYGDKQALFDINLSIPNQSVTAFIGASGCGKSTLLRSINRMNDFIDSFEMKGTISFKNENIYGSRVDAVELRRKIGMVFQKPNPFPKSVFDNVAWGPRIHNETQELNARVEASLKKAALWDEVKDRLKSHATELSGGQQQRLCIARAIAMNPDVILMDEPCSALDPKSTARIEDLVNELKKSYCIVIVTHNMQQASRVSDQTAFFHEGHLIELGATKDLFSKPKKKMTDDYISGRFG